MESHKDASILQSLLLYLCLPDLYFNRSISAGKFTTESDVWAFAVTLWEILTLAAEYPYDELTDEQVIENIQRMFFRPSDPNIFYLERPSVCPRDVYDMMKSCWLKDPNARPDFKALHDFFKRRVRLSEMAI